MKAAAFAACLLLAIAMIGDGVCAAADLPLLPQRVETSALPNVVRLTPKVYSGGLPAGDGAFDELSRLGVRTIISVDGARPDVAAAEAAGMRYVHLPHGYDGVPSARAAELSKAVRDLPGPIYLHCHHGKHRSPAAAAVACVGAGLLDAAQTNNVLQLADTSPRYRGLVAAAKSARPLEPATLDALEPEFPAVAHVPPLAEAMVAIERTHDRLQKLAAAGWRPPASHPDLDPAHEALLLREHYTELLRSEAIKSQPEEFRRLNEQAEHEAKWLEKALAKKTGSKKDWRASLGRLSTQCQECHARFRDVPLGEK